MTQQAKPLQQVRTANSSASSSRGGGRTATTASHPATSSAARSAQVTQVTRNENHTPTAFHANIIAMDKGLLDIEDVADDYVHCTQCGACEIRCPNTLFVGDFYRPDRDGEGRPGRTGTDGGQGLDRDGWKLWNRLTNELKNEPVLGTENGQPNGQEHVRDWAEGLQIPIGGETIMFVDCEAAFYRTSNTRATAQVLQKAGFEFGLMNEQWCCGGPAAEMGYVQQSGLSPSAIWPTGASGVKRMLSSRMTTSTSRRTIRRTSGKTSTSRWCRSSSW